MKRHSVEYGPPVKVKFAIEQIASTAGYRMQLPVNASDGNPVVVIGAGIVEASIAFHLARCNLP